MRYTGYNRAVVWRWKVKPKVWDGSEEQPVTIEIEETESSYPVVTIRVGCRSVSMSLGIFRTLCRAFRSILASWEKGKRPKL